MSEHGEVPKDIVAKEENKASRLSTQIKDYLDSLPAKPLSGVKIERNTQQAEKGDPRAMDLIKRSKQAIAEFLKSKGQNVFYYNTDLKIDAAPHYLSRLKTSELDSPVELSGEIYNYKDQGIRIDLGGYDPAAPDTVRNSENNIGLGFDIYSDDSVNIHVAYPYRVAGITGGPATYDVKEQLGNTRTMDLQLALYFMGDFIQSQVEQTAEKPITLPPDLLLTHEKFLPPSNKLYA